MRMDTEVLMKKYKDCIFAVAFNICKAQADADDIVQDTFLQYYLGTKQFETEQHIKAWLIRVAINKSKNMRLSCWWRKIQPLEEYIETLIFETPESQHLFEQVLKLSEKYRIVLHLFYYEEYSITEIASLLHISENNVKIRLMRARKLLKEALKEEWDSDDE